MENVMKRTTIMIEPDVLYDLQQLAQERSVSTSQLIREALATYVIKQQKRNLVVNPLLALAGLGASEEVTDVADGQDEQILRKGIDPITGWSNHDEPGY